jgi:hypothetical protein
MNREGFPATQASNRDGKSYGLAAAGNKDVRPRRAKGSLLFAIARASLGKS